MIKLYLDRSLCDNCGECDTVYSGIRRTIEIMDESPLDLDTWDAIGEIAEEAFSACPFGAIGTVDEEY